MNDYNRYRKYVVVTVIDGNQKNYEVWGYNEEDAQDDALAQALFDGTKVTIKGVYLSGDQAIEEVDRAYDC